MAGGHTFYEGEAIYKKTGRKLEFNGKELVGFDKNKIECFNCHRRGHFARDWKSIKNSRNMSRDAGNARYRGRDNGYDSQFNEKEVLDIKEEEVTETVFDNHSSDKENNVANDRFKKGKGYHAVPPPFTVNYMPPKPDLSFARLDDFIYKFMISETVTSLAKDEKDATETSIACVEKPKEDRSSTPLIKDWETDSNDDNVFTPEPIPAKIDLMKAVFTRSGRIPVSAANPKAATSTSAAKPVNTVGPKQSVNFSRTRISYVKGNGVTAVKTLAGCVWRPRVNEIDQLSKDNRWICTCVDYLDPQGRLNGFSRHMTRNKAYLAIIKRFMMEVLFLLVQVEAEAVNTACYVLNRDLVTKTHNKTPYELLNGRSHRLDFMRPFGCHVTILNTLDPLGKFKGKADEGFLVGYSVTVFVRNQTDKNAGPQDTNGNADDKPADDKPKDDTGSKAVEEPVNKEDQAYRDELDRLISQEKEAIDAANALRKEFEQGCMYQRGVTQAGSTNSFNTDKADFNNMVSSAIVSPILTHKVHIDHPKDQILGSKVSSTNKGDGKEEFWSTFSFDLPYGKKAIGTKWVYRNKKDERGIVVRNKARLGAQGHRQEEGIDYDKSEERIFISQDKYVAAILKKFDFSSVKTDSTSIETQKPFVKDEVTPKLSHIQAVKRIFRYLKGQPKLGLWYPRDSLFNLEAYSDSDYTGANLDRKSTIGGCQFFGRRLISWQCKKHTIITTSTTEAKYVAATHCCGQTQAPRNHIGGVDAQTRFETASKRYKDPPLSTSYTVGSEEDKMEQETNLTDFIPPTTYDLPLLRGHIPRSDEGRPNLLELMNIYTKLSNRILALKEAKTTQDKVITKLKLRVRRLEKKRKARTSQPMKRRLFKRRVETSTDKSLEDKGSGEKGGSTVDQVSTTRPEVSAATPSTPPTITTIFGDEDLTIAQTLIKMRSERKKELLSDMDQGLAQIESDADLIQRIYKEELAELDRAQKERQKQKEATIAALIEDFDEIQAIMDADHELAIRMTHEDAEAIRNKPPKRTQVRNMMITYLKHMGKYTHQQLKHKTLEELHMLYEREKKWIDDFVPMDSEKEEKKSVEPESKDKKGKRIKRVADSTLKHKSSKKQKMIEKVSFHQGNGGEMLNWKLEAEAKSTMAFEPLKFIKSQIEECKDVWIHLPGNQDVDNEET
nr:hypothetical protein [Tanacetum cinerariifolium]